MRVALCNRLRKIDLLPGGLHPPSPEIYWRRIRIRLTRTKWPGIFLSWFRLTRPQNAPCATLALCTTTPLPCSNFLKTLKTKVRTWKTALTEDFQLLFAIELGLVRILQPLVSIREGIESSGKQSTACLRKAKYSSWRSALTKDFQLF